MIRCISFAIAVIGLIPWVDAQDRIPDELYAPTTSVPTELKIGSDDRVLLFSILRKETDGKVKFAGSLKTCKNWALFVGSTVHPDGRPRVLVNMGDENDSGNTDACALWLHTSQGWKLVDFSFGHSDAFYLIWPKQYGAPNELF